MAGDFKRVLCIIKRIRPLLAGNPAQVQGAVLADLLAMWLAGHVSLKSREATEANREELLAMHIETVRQLVPENAKAMRLPW